MEAGAIIALIASLGFGAGALHFALLHHGVGQLVSGGSAVGAVATTLGRFAITVAMFLLVAVFHGLAVVWMLAGFVLARFTVVRIVKAEA